MMAPRDGETSVVTGWVIVWMWVMRQREETGRKA